MSGLLTVIIPAFNEEATVAQAVAAISDTLEAANIPFELLFVDDGSKDRTWECIRAASATDGRIRGVSLSRNFGKDNAIFAGLSRARGDCCAVIDCDLQHPPEVLVEMYSHWRRGFQVVEGRKKERGRESGVHTLCARAFNDLISRASGLDMYRSSDFRLLDRKVVDVLLSMPEHDAFFRGLSTWIGFQRISVSFSVRERTAGESKWSTRALIHYAITSILSFSTSPMQMATVAGGLVLLATTISIAAYAIFGGNRGGDGDLLLVFACIGLVAMGCILLALGILGYYLSRIYRQVLGRPRYIIAEECGGAQ